MKRGAVLLATVLLLSVAFTSEVWSLERDEATHLLRRTGFDPAPAEVEALLGLSYEQAVDRIIYGVRLEPVTPSPEWVDEAPVNRRAKTRDMPEEERRKFNMELNKLNRERGLELKAWWYREMIDTDSPFTERMTLFWHNHFTSSLRKVRFPQAMYRQNMTLRRLALGNFRDLVHETAKDPAMIVYLDGRQNRKGKPNENYARELMELFTLGEGHYTERDIKQAARAFTGWTVNPKTGQYAYAHRQHDEGDKAFFGKRGRWDGEQIIEIILEQPEVATYITEKLWREFVSPEPDAAEVGRLAGVFREANYDLKPLMREMLLSEAFRDPANRGVLVKSPAEMMVGTVRMFEVPVMDTRIFVGAGRQMNQDILDPPNVKGWEGGTSWINSTTLLARRQMLERALRGMEEGFRPPMDQRMARERQVAQADGAETMAPRMRPAMQGKRGMGGRGAELRRPPRVDLATWAEQLRDERLTLTQLENHMLAAPRTNPVAADAYIDDAIRMLVMDPAYQLK